MKNLQDKPVKQGAMFLLTLLSLCCHFPMLATHLVGGEMYYDHLGGDTYEVHLIIYRDCGPTNTNGTGFDLSAAIGVYQNSTLYSDATMQLDFNAVTNIDLLSGNPCALLPPGVCIERAEYISILNLPASDQNYTIVYQRCCRNPQVINLEDATNTGFTMFTEVPAVNSGPDIDTGSNSSSRFAALPQAYVCQGQPFELTNLATDPDGDSLIYSIGDVFIGGSFSAPTPSPPTGPPFNNVTWAEGYNALNPLGTGAMDNLQIDPSNGTLSANPSVVGKYVVGIYVTEFRQNNLGNWVPLGKVIRDFTIDVVPCEVLLPEVYWPAPCSGLDVAFDVDATEGQFSWSFGAGEGGSEDASPDHNYAEEGVYLVSLVYDLDGCADSLTQTITVSPPYSAEFSLGEATCLANGWSQPVDYNGDDGGSGGVVWYVDGNEVATGYSVEDFALTAGSHSIVATLTNSYGCTFDSEASPVLPELPFANFEMSEPPCNGLDITFNNLSSGASDYAWTFDLDASWTGSAEESSQADPTWAFQSFGTAFTQLVAQPGEACADTLIQEVTILPVDPLVMAFGAVEPLACSLETTVEFTFTGAYADLVEWDFASFGSATGDTVNFDFTESGLFEVMLTIENDTCGTNQSVEFEVYVPELVSEVELVIPNVITPNADGKNDRFRVGTKRVNGNGVDPANASSFSQFKLQVYDRWGVLVHQSEGIGAGWDGRIGGRIAAPGVYYYILNADHSCLDADLQEVGELTLILD
jgi:gliding motility-associated-like protein